MLSWADLITNLGFVLAVDNCARGCLHCPAFGAIAPVQRAPLGQLADRLAQVANARARLGLGRPQRVIHSWRISDPLDYTVRTPAGTIASVADLGALWREHLGQGLYVVTNGSEGRPQAVEALRRIASEPQLVSQVKLTITPADTAWGTTRYETDLAADLSILAPLWNLPAQRAEDPHGLRLRVNVKTAPSHENQAREVVARILAAAGVNPAVAGDPRRVAFKPVYDLGNALGVSSPVPGAVTIAAGGQRCKPTPETRAQIQYGIRPDGRLFAVDMYAFTERDLTDREGRKLLWPNVIADLHTPVTDV